VLRSIDIPSAEWPRLIRALFEGDRERKLRGGQFEIADESHQIVAVVPIGRGRTDETND